MDESCPLPTPADPQMLGSMDGALPPRSTNPDPWHASVLFATDGGSLSIYLCSQVTARWGQQPVHGIRLHMSQSVCLRHSAASLSSTRRVRGAVLPARWGSVWHRPTQRCCPHPRAHPRAHPRPRPRHHPGPHPWSHPWPHPWPCPRSHPRHRPRSHPKARPRARPRQSLPRAQAVGARPSTWRRCLLWRQSLNLNRSSLCACAVDVPTLRPFPQEWKYPRSRPRPAWPAPQIGPVCKADVVAAFEALITGGGIAPGECEQNRSHRVTLESFASAI